MKWIGKKLMTVMLCLSMVLSSLVICIDKNKKTAEASVNHTVDEAIAWAASQVGKSLEGDNYYGSNNEAAYQCVDFIICYYKYLGVTPATGNGCDYAGNALPAGWTRVQGGQPQKGDILVYSGNSQNPAGHVAIYESDRSTYHQNFNNCRKVTHETIRYNGFTNAYWGYIRPDWGSLNRGNDPQGNVDVCTSQTAGELLLQGWAFDADHPATQISIHVYIGSDDNAVSYNLGPATTSRPDIDNTYHCGEFHGFDFKVKTDRLGNQRVRVWAINVGGGVNKCLYDNTVYIKSDSENPTFESCRISKLNEKGYTITCTWSDNVGVTEVKFPTKSEKKDSSWKWYEGKSDEVGKKYSTWTFTFDEGIAGEKYTTHIYAYDKEGNYTSYGLPNYIALVNDTESPKYNNVTLKQENEGELTFQAEITDDIGLNVVNTVSSPRYYYSEDEKSSYVLGYAAETVSNMTRNSLVVKKFDINYVCRPQCDSIFQFFIDATDLNGNHGEGNYLIHDTTNNQDTSYYFYSAKSGHIKGQKNQSIEICIKPGEKVSYKTIKEKMQKLNNQLDAFYAYTDAGNQRILKKNIETANVKKDDEDSLVFTGNQEGVEYIYFANLLTGTMLSCKIVVQADKTTDPSIGESTEVPENPSPSPTASIVPTATPDTVLPPTPVVTPTSTGKVTLPPQTQTPDNPGSQIPGDTQTDGKWNTIYFGRYWQDDTNGDGTTDEKDEMQPIQWRILRQDGNYALLLADKILDSGKYYKGEESSWETSDLRNWLNSKFYATAFNEREQKAIQVQILQNGDGKDPILLTTNTTMDKVFVPSHDDMLRSEYGFGNAAYNEADDARIASNTKYTAGKPGMYSSTECADAYWLRNSSNSLSSAQTVMTQGILSPSISVQTISGVRPMIYVDLSDRSLWKSGTQVRSGKMGEAGSINGITSTSDGNFVLSDKYYPFGKVATGDNNATPKPEQPSGSPIPSASDETKTSATPLPSASAKAKKTEYRVNIDDDDISAPAKPGKVKIKKASALKNGKVKLTWKKPARAKWYIIQYSRKRNFAGAKIGMVYGKKTTLRLKKNRTYYIRIRAYAYGNSANNNRAVKGKWSKVKKVKTKG